MYLLKGLTGSHNTHNLSRCCLLHETQVHQYNRRTEARTKKETDTKDIFNAENMSFSEYKLL